MARQLVLPFTHRPDYAGADLLAAGSNAEALAWLDRTGGWPGGRLALWGQTGVGKTHLLHVWARDVRVRGQSAIILAGDALPDLLSPPCRPIALDQAQAVDERALLHLLNSAAEAGWPVLLADRLPPARWATRLADLASRLRATTAVQIAPAEDALLRPLLARLLAERQLAVAEPVQSWLLARLPRSPAALVAAAAGLDRAGLAAGRPITRPLAAEALRTLLSPDLLPPDLPCPDRVSTDPAMADPAMAETATADPLLKQDVSAANGHDGSSRPTPLLYSLDDVAELKT